MKSKLADLLIRHDIIDSAAIEDPEGFDGGRIRRAVLDAEIELAQSEDVTPDKPGWYWVEYNGEFAACFIPEYGIHGKIVTFNGAKTYAKDMLFAMCRFRPCVNPFEGEGAT